MRRKINVVQQGHEFFDLRDVAVALFLLKCGEIPDIGPIIKKQLPHILLRFHKNIY
jgi:hypothetical protein